MYTSDANNHEPKIKKEAAQPSIASVLSKSAANTSQNPGKTSNSNPSPSSGPSSGNSQQTFDPATMPPPSSNFNPNDSILVSDADLLLNFHSPFSTNSPNTMSHPSILHQPQMSSFVRGTLDHSQHQQHPSQFSPTGFGQYAASSDNLPNMVIDSQDVDMSTLGADMMPWDLEYLPHDFMFYGDNNFGVGDNEDHNAGGGA